MTITRTISTLAAIGTGINAADVTTPDNELLALINNLVNGIDSAEQFRFDQIASPSAPASGKNLVYFKSDNYPYMVGNSFAERMLGACQLIMPRTALGVAASTMPSSTIPGTFKHLLVNVEARTDVAAAGDSVLMRYNGDTGSNYDYQFSNASATTLTAAESLAAAYVLLPFAAIGNTGPAGNGSAWAFITNYASSTLMRMCHIDCGSRTGTTTGLLKDSRGKGWWRNVAAAITSLTFYPLSGSNFAAGSAITVYGMN